MKDFVVSEFPKVLLQESKRAGIDYRLVMAVIAQESEFKPGAVGHAGEVGLNAGKFKKDWDDPKIKAEVDQDSKAGTAAGASTCWPRARNRATSLRKVVAGRPSRFAISS